MQNCSLPFLVIGSRSESFVLRTVVAFDISIVLKMKKKHMVVSLSEGDVVAVYVLPQP